MTRRKLDDLSDGEFVARLTFRHWILKIDLKFAIKLRQGFLAKNTNQKFHNLQA